MHNTEILTDIYSIKSNGTLKILILGICGLREVFTRFSAVLMQGHTIIMEIYSSSFNTISRGFADSFSVKSDKGTVHILGI